MKIHPYLYGVVGVGFIAWLFLLAWLAPFYLSLGFLALTLVLAIVCQRYAATRPHGVPWYLLVPGFLGWGAVGVSCFTYDIPRRLHLLVNITARQLDLTAPAGVELALRTKQLKLISAAGTGLGLTAPRVRLADETTLQAVKGQAGAAKLTISPRTGAQARVNIFLEAGSHSALLQMGLAPGNVRLDWDRAGNGGGTLRINPPAGPPALTLSAESFVVEVRNCTVQFGDVTAEVADQSVKLAGRLSSGRDDVLTLAFDPNRRSNDDDLEIILQPDAGTHLVGAETKPEDFPRLICLDATGVLTVGHDHVSLTQYALPPRIDLHGSLHMESLTLPADGFHLQAKGKADSVRVEDDEKIASYFWLNVIPIAVAILSAMPKVVMAEIVSMYKKLFPSPGPNP